MEGADVVAVAFLLVWGGYSTGLWGWCLLRDYDVTFGQLVSPGRPYAGPWPPARIPSSQTWPSGAAAKASTAAAVRPSPVGAPAQSFAPVQNATGAFPTLQPGGQIIPGTA